MKCPHCNREIEMQKMYIERAFIKCRKCLQIIEIKNNEPIKAIPKEIIYKKILLLL
jgi:transcription elongation factor Elf1